MCILMGVLSDFTVIISTLVNVSVRYDDDGDFLLPDHARYLGFPPSGGVGKDNKDGCGVGSGV